jgi:hypothetical protein
MKKAEGVQKANLFFDRFEAIAEAAVVAMFDVDGRIDDTGCATVDVNAVNAITPTRKFKAALRRELKARNFHIWAKSQKWA